MDHNDSYVVDQVYNLNSNKEISRIMPNKTSTLTILTHLSSEKTIIYRNIYNIDLHQKKTMPQKISSEIAYMR